MTFATSATMNYITGKPRRPYNLSEIVAQAMPIWIVRGDEQVQVSDVGLILDGLGGKQVAS